MPNNFQITSLSYQILALNQPVGGTYNGDYITVTGSDIAGNPFSKDSDPIASGGSTNCTDQNGNPVGKLNSLDPTWFSITNQGGTVTCQECPREYISMPDVGGNRICQHKTCPPGEVISNDGHTCSGVFGGSGNGLLPIPKTAPCGSVQIQPRVSNNKNGPNFFLYNAFDFDRRNKDVTLAVIDRFFENEDAKYFGDLFINNLKAYMVNGGNNDPSKEHDLIQFRDEGALIGRSDYADKVLRDEITDGMYDSVNFWKTVFPRVNYIDLPVKVMSPSIGEKIPSLAGIILHPNQALILISLDLSLITKNIADIDLHIFDISGKISHVIKLRFIKDKSGNWSQVSCR